jgi:hypothetical protein
MQSHRNTSSLLPFLFASSGWKDQQSEGGRPLAVGNTTIDHPKLTRELERT